MSKLILITNRLPVTIEKRKNQLHYRKSVGGLATGLASISNNLHAEWVGWCGMASNSVDHIKRKEIEETCLEKHHCHTLFLTRKSVKSFYAGFCNKTIWPLFHYFLNYTKFDNSFWESYKHVNKIFSHSILKTATPEDIIWIHDYHLMLLPEMIREKLPQVKIGFFLHIPFPSFEIFRLLPWRKEILSGLLGADLIGFHTYDYVRHFTSSIRRILGIEHNFNQIHHQQRIIKVDAFPMGVDFDSFNKSESNFEYIRDIQKTCNPDAKCKIILSVDRLDYTKGIPQRLEAFERFLEKYPEYRQKVSLILVAVPSRTNVESYQAQKQRIDELIGSINGRYGTMGWLPVWYFYRYLSFKNLASLYKIADIALVTPLRDGMNLIAKEYVASKHQKNGVLILSETAGAVAELSEALIINPNDIEEIADSIQQAISMPAAEQEERFEIMRTRIKRYNIKAWADDFLTQLSYVKTLQTEYHTRQFSPAILSQIYGAYQKAKQRLILLDLDNTLTSKTTIKEKDLKNSIRSLASMPQNEIVIISSQNRTTLEKWINNKSVGIAAEHGLWIREKQGQWHRLKQIHEEWKPEIRLVLENFVDRTPGSYIKENSFSFEWHFHKSEPDLGPLRQLELKESLFRLAANLNLSVIEGEKVLVIRWNGFNKGMATSFWTSNRESNFILAISDNWTSEDVFSVLPDWAISIRMGSNESQAKYFVENYHDVHQIIKTLNDF